MSCHIALLIVEDDKELVESWSRDIEEFNIENKHGVSITHHRAAYKEEAEEVLRTTNIDAAIVDLRIPTKEADGRKDGTGSNGNGVLETITKSFPIPLVIYSGHIGDLDARFGKDHIKLLQKEGGGQAIALQHIAEQLNLIEALKTTRETILSASAEIFHKSIWPRWAKHWEVAEDPMLLANIVSRQIVGHVADQISFNASLHDPEEFYVVPPIHDTMADTGDLFTLDDKLYVLLTPRCDLAQDKGENLLLVECREDNAEEWTSIIDGHGSGTENKVKSAVTRARKKASQDVPISRHFLPCLNGCGPWLVHFDMIKTLPKEQVIANLDSRIGSIAPHFVPNLVQRFSTYWGRIGQPDIDPEILIQRHKSRVND